jgi:hypothetical protein
MGDWHTLHFFDIKKYLSEVVPTFKNDRQKLAEYISSDFGRPHISGGLESDQLATQIMEYSNSLSGDLMLDPTLVGIRLRKQREDESHLEYVRNQHKEIEDYYSTRSGIIEIFCRLLTLVVFSECALFNPHVKLGKGLFHHHVIVKENSVASEATRKFYSSEAGSVFEADLGRVNRVVNWLTHEELQLLKLDKTSFQPISENERNYLEDFTHFLDTALQHGLGFISCINMTDQPYPRIPSPFKVNIDLSRIGNYCIIEEGLL